MSATLRKIVQITGGACDESPARLYALCSDGSVWERVFHESGNAGWTCVDTGVVTTSAAEPQP